MAEVKLQTGTGVFEVLAHVCRSPMEAFRQFVENSADAIEQVAEKEGFIRITLERKKAPDSRESLPVNISVQDNGIGMSQDKARQVVQTIGDSEKLNLVLRGEKGIGLLAFAQIATELHLCTTPAADTPSVCLVLKKEWLRSGLAQIVEQCPLHSRSKRGTTAYLMDILPAVASQLTKSRIKECLGREFANDLRHNMYSMLIRDDNRYEPIEPQRFRGISALTTTISLGSHRYASLELYALPMEVPDAAVSLYGRGGTRVCHLIDIEEFKKRPWSDQRLEGYVRCDWLKRTADKTAVVQDEIYFALARELHAMEPRLEEQLQTVAREYEVQRMDQIVRRVDTFISRFLRYLESGGVLPEPRPALVAQSSVVEEQPTAPPPQLKPRAASQPARPRTPHVPLLRVELSSPTEQMAPYRSWYDTDTGVIRINREHTNFLKAERDNRQCAWYLFNIWVKERLLAEYGSDAAKLADEMVGLLTEAEPLFGQLLAR